MSSEQKADEVLHDPAAWAAIEEYWPPSDIDPETCAPAELKPEYGSPADHAMLLWDMLRQRALTPKAQSNVDKFRVKMGQEKYDSGRNAENVLAQFKLLAATA